MITDQTFHEHYHSYPIGQLASGVHSCIFKAEYLIVPISLCYMKLDFERLLPHLAGEFINQGNDRVLKERRSSQRPLCHLRNAQLPIRPHVLKHRV